MALHVHDIQAADGNQATIVLRSDAAKPADAIDELRSPEAAQLAIKAAAEYGVTRAQLDPVSRTNAPYAVDQQGVAHEEPIPMSEVKEYRANLRVQAGFI